MLWRTKGKGPELSRCGHGSRKPVFCTRQGAAGRSVLLPSAAVPETDLDKEHLAAQQYTQNARSRVCSLTYNTGDRATHRVSWRARGVDYAQGHPGRAGLGSAALAFC